MFFNSRVYSTCDKLINKLITRENYKFYSSHNEAFITTNFDFLNLQQNCSKRHVMHLALPVSVKFLHKGNKELSRNVASYLSMAAIENADLLAPHIQVLGM